METHYDGVTVQLTTHHTTAHITSPTLPGLTCTTHDLWQIAQLLTRAVSGTITLQNGTPLEVLSLPDRLDLRHDGQHLVRITPDVKPGTQMNDLTGFYSALHEITRDDQDELQLHPHYGYFLEMSAHPTDAWPKVNVLNRELQHLGTLTLSDLPPLRRFLDGTAQAIFLSNLLIKRQDQAITVQPDNRPRELPAGHHQWFNLEDPLEMTPEAARHLTDTAEFFLEFESTPQTLD